MEARLRRIALGSILGVAVLTASFLSLGPDQREPGASILFVQVPASAGDSAPDWRFPDRSRIVALRLRQDKRGRDVEVLTDDFVAARAPDVSFDGRAIVFAGRRSGEGWQIWEMDLEGRATRRITDGFEAATEPAYLPDGTIVFSARRQGGDSFALYTSDRDGDEVARITYHPQDDVAPSILADGRVLFLTADPSTTPAATKLMAVRSDGTGLSLYYGGEAYSTPLRKAWPRGARVYFSEASRDGDSGRPVSISDARPLHSRRVVLPDHEGEFRTVFPVAGGGLIASYRPPDSPVFSLYGVGPGFGDALRELHIDPAFHAVEPVDVSPRPRPLGFLSIVDPTGDTGWLYCLNANHSTLPARRSVVAEGQSLQIIGTGGLLGEVPLHGDGSFYVEVPADTPLRFVTVDEEGATVRGPSSWTWVRPNEQRGCIGCHENRELSPENRVPEALRTPPHMLSRAFSAGREATIGTTAAP